MYVYANMARLERESGNRKQAIKLFEKALEIEPTNQKYKNDIAALQREEETVKEVSLSLHKD
jgi:tetratricopeptide (TPR) repeat protein